MYNTGNHKAAVKSYKKPIGIKHDYARAHYNLSYSYLILDDRTSALDEYKILQKLNPLMAVDLSKTAVKKARTAKNNKYIIQLAAFKNINSANSLLKKLETYYMHAYIKRENSFSKVRITGINTRDELNLIKEDIIKRFKTNPYTIKLQ